MMIMAETIMGVIRISRLEGYKKFKRKENRNILKTWKFAIVSLWRS